MSQKRYINFKENKGLLGFATCASKQSFFGAFYMLFSSLEFIYLFLPLTLFLYFLSPWRAKNYVLLVVSLVFYGIAQPSLLPLMLGVSLANYIFGLLIYRAKSEKRADIYTWLAVLLNAGVLFVFKYFGLFVRLLDLPIDAPPLPTGISFYTFQALSYVIDVRRRAAEVQKNPLLFTTYVTLFPQLVAGPIVRYSEIDGELKKRRHTVERVASGARLFCIGLSKKVLLANPAGECWKRMARYSGENGTVLGAWLGVVFFAFQIYFDFSGYSDMARGLGRIFGFEFPENFNYPYISRSITEFWRRWHITLSSWFREYVYIPLGGNRHGRGRMYVNLLVTWLLTGLWHGASFNFLLWGLYFFLLLAIEKLFLLRFLERIPRVFGHVYALVFILIGWLIFVSDGTLTLLGAQTYFGEMFGVGTMLWNNDALLELRRNALFLIIMAFASTPLAKTLAHRLLRLAPCAARVVFNAVAIASVVISTAYLTDSSYNPFLYFRF